MVDDAELVAACVLAALLLVEGLLPLEAPLAVVFDAVSANCPTALSLEFDEIVVNDVELVAARVLAARLLRSALSFSSLLLNNVEAAPTAYGDREYRVLGGGSGRGRLGTLALLLGK